MMKKLMDFLKQDSIIQFIKFGLVGGLNTFLSLAIYYLCIYLGFGYLVGNTVGFIITVAISYVLNNLFTFKGEGKPTWSLKALVKVYISYSVTGLFLNNALSYLWVDVLGISDKIAPLINMCFSIPINFLLNKFWAYRK